MDTLTPDSGFVEADFTPQLDITPYELALLLKALIVGFAVSRAKMEELPPSILRHLTLRESHG